MSSGLDAQSVEVFYDALARAIDRVPATEEAALLCRLCLLLAHQTGDLGVALAALDAALASVDGAASPAGEA